jgi:hypothetical protein
MRSVDAGALTVAQLQPGQVGLGLVGEEHLEAVAVVVGEAQLGAGMGVLASADRPRARWPVAQVDPAGQLAHLGIGTDLAVSVPGCSPAGLGLDQDRLAHMLVDRHAEGEADLALVQVPGQPAAGPGAVAAHQDRLGMGGNGELGQGQLDQCDQVTGITSGGVAWSQQAGQRLTGGLAAVQVGQQRVDTGWNPKVCL